jgi:hypothetical protein
LWRWRHHQTELFSDQWCLWLSLEAQILLFVLPLDKFVNLMNYIGVTGMAYSLESYYILRMAWNKSHFLISWGTCNRPFPASLDIYLGLVTSTKGG